MMSVLVICQPKYPTAVKGLIHKNKQSKTVTSDPLQTHNTNPVHKHTHPQIYWISLSEVLSRCLVARLLLGSESGADASRVSPTFGLCVIIFSINYSLKTKDFAVRGW